MLTIKIKSPKAFRLMDIQLIAICCRLLFRQAAMTQNLLLAVCAMSNSNIDVSKYGFELSIEKEFYKVYVAKVENEIVELIVSGDTYTVKISGKRNIMVANRYKASTQEQLDFLLINGRVGVLFSSFCGSNKT